MTLARMPESVREALIRTQTDMSTPEGVSPTEGTVEVIRTEGNYFWNGWNWVWKPERDVIVWNYKDESTGIPTQQTFERESTWDGGPGGDPAPVDSPENVSNLFRNVVKAWQADIDLANKWNRGSKIDIYRLTPEKALDMDLYHAGNTLKEKKKPMSSTGARASTKAHSGGSTILTGGLGRYQEPETQKKKLGA